jgi:hypothetical protein
VHTAMSPDGSKSDRQLMTAIARSRRSNAVHLSLIVDRQLVCSADDRSRAPAHSHGDGDRNSFVASPGPATASSRSRPHLAVTTPTSQPIARGSQIPIAPARRTVVPMPARGFLPRGLSNACPASAPHCQVTGRRLITLNNSSHSSSSEQRGARDHPAKPWCRERCAISSRAPGCALTAPCAERFARTRRSTSAVVNRCQARSADLLSSDACSRYRIGAGAAQSRRGSGRCKGLATTNV